MNAADALARIEEKLVGRLARARTWDTGPVKRHGPAYYHTRTAARVLLAAAVVALVMLR